MNSYSVYKQKVKSVQLDKRLDISDFSYVFFALNFIFDRRFLSSTPNFIQLLRILKITFYNGYRPVLIFHKNVIVGFGCIKLKGKSVPHIRSVSTANKVWIINCRVLNRFQGRGFFKIVLFLIVKSIEESKILMPEDYVWIDAEISNKKSNSSMISLGFQLT